MKRIALAAAFAFAFAATTASAQQPAPCNTHEFIVEQITGKYGESRVMSGITDGGNVFELFANEETGTWTVIVSFPRGMSCVPALGADFQAAPPAPKGDPS